jgi:hypothetical protein
MNALAGGANMQSTHIAALAMLRKINNETE